MAINKSLDALLYRGPANTTATTLMTNIKDLSVSDDRTEGDTSIRGNPFECAVGTMRKLSIDFQMLADDADADYAALQAAYIAMTPTAFKCISKSGGKGIDADFYIMKFQRNEGLKDVTTVDVTIKPTYAGTTPRYPANV